MDYGIGKSQKCEMKIEWFIKDKRSIIMGLSKIILNSIYGLSGFGDF